MAEEDVKDEGSSPSGEQPEETDASVTGEKGDRPIQNVVAEFNRKFKKTDEKIDAVLAYLVNQQQAVNQQATRQPEQPKTELSDQDIFALAQQGDQDAFAEWTRRQAKKVYQQENTQQTHARIIQGQLAALMGKYPVLNNPQHPLTQVVNQAYALYLQSGYPAGQETLLKAATTAISDRPDLVSELYNSGATAREQTRRSAASNAQSGVTGVSHRNDSPRSNGKQRLTEEQIRLARQMGLTPEKAAGSIARFHKRREEGISKLGAVGNMLDEESL